MSKYNKIISTFLEEFGFLKEKFDCLNFPVTEIPKERNPYRAGVYVFYTDIRIWKVGKSNDNAIKRALEHFTADTGNGIGKGMKKHKDDSTMKLVLFLIKDPKDLHWVFALECYFEIKFRKENLLEIYSARLG